MTLRFLTLVTIATALFASSGHGEELSPDVVRDAFIATCDGYSSDELLIRDPLRESFLDNLSKRLDCPRSDDFEREALLKLIGMRKAGKLRHSATRRAAAGDPSVQPVAEIASRAVMDRHRVSTDTILADPRLRRELHAEAEKISAAIDPYSIRKAVLSLRKRRQLKPELVLKAVDWQRQVQSMRLGELRNRLDNDEISDSPGIYLFRDASGYLYIGEADKLAVRLRQHTDDSDRQSLADYLSRTNEEDITVELHVFPKNSPAKGVTARRAYESELIRSRVPKFNVRP